MQRSHLIEREENAKVRQKLSDFRKVSVQTDFTIGLKEVAPQI